MHQHDDAIAYLEQAIRINPSFAQAYFALGFTLIVGGRASEAMPYLDRSVELSPHDPHLSSIYAIRALGHLVLDELGTAESFARMATRSPNVNRWPFLVLASLLGLRDRTEDARRALSALLERSSPEFCLADARSEIFFCRDQTLAERYLDGLRRAGLPESVAPPHGRPGHRLAVAGV
jgi:tetratricopeptide (TPR) repeat protein